MLPAPCAGPASPAHRSAIADANCPALPRRGAVGGISTSEHPLGLLAVLVSVVTAPAYAGLTRASYKLCTPVLALLGHRHRPAAPCAPATTSTLLAQLRASSARAKRWTLSRGSSAEQKSAAVRVPSQKVDRNRDRARAAQSVRGRVQRTYSAWNVCRCFCASGAPNTKAPPPSPSTAPFHLNIHLLARLGPWGPPRPRRASDAPRLIFSCPNFPPFRGGEGRAPAQAPPPPRPLPESSLQRWASRRPSPRRGRVPPPCVYPGHRPPRRRAETCTADDFRGGPATVLARSSVVRTGHSFVVRGSSSAETPHSQCIGLEPI